MQNYPEEAEIGGKIYKINYDYRTALACFKAIEDEEINDIERTFAVIGLLFGEDVPYEHYDIALKKASLFLCCGNDTQDIKGFKKDMDYEYDEKYILASFVSDYNIDLSKETDMHWWKFNSLISGLTDKSILSRIRDLRNTDLSLYTNPNQKAKIIRAMENVKLPIKHSKEQEEAIDEFENLFK